MIARLLLVGSMALATLPTSRLPQRGLAFEALSSDISVTVVAPRHVPGEAPPNVQVQISGPGRPDNRTGPFPKPLSNMAIQVWLLRIDGTTLAQRSRFPIPTIVLSNVGSEFEVMSFSFEPADPDDLAGVVVRAGGKLDVRELKATRQ